MAKKKLFGLSLPVIAIAGAGAFVLFTKAGKKMLGIKPAMPAPLANTSTAKFYGWTFDEVSWSWKPLWVRITSGGGGGGYQGSSS